MWNDVGRLRGIGRSAAGVGSMRGARIAGRCGRRVNVLLGRPETRLPYIDG